MLALLFAVNEPRYLIFFFGLKHIFFKIIMFVSLSGHSYKVGLGAYLGGIEGFVSLHRIFLIFLGFLRAPGCRLKTLKNLIQFLILLQATKTLATPL